MQDAKSYHVSAPTSARHHTPFISQNIFTSPTTAIDHRDRPQLATEDERIHGYTLYDRDRGHSYLYNGVTILTRRRRSIPQWRCNTSRHHLASHGAYRAHRP